MRAIRITKGRHEDGFTVPADQQPMIYALLRHHGVEARWTKLLARSDSPREPVYWRLQVDPEQVALVQDIISSAR